jgi:RHH-type proline utilization regulon transcriptional repressor/proline dehydrogenase/delta 1-pyrroline-5-carboxylate dehydrogenase
MSIEDRAQEIGRKIYAAAERESPSLFDRKRWMGRLMEWAMKDEAFKIQLFRFIDVLPSLKTDELVVKLLREYFTEETNGPEIIQWAIRRIRGKAVLPFVTARVVRAAVESLARQFIAGSDPEDSLPSFSRLKRERAAFSIDLLGEVVVSDREAEEYAARYLALLDFLHERAADLGGAGVTGEAPLFDISLKISSFYSQLDPMDWEGSVGGIRKNLRPIFEKAQKLGLSLTFDMEHYYYKDLTLAVFKGMLEEFADFPFAGIALQAYLRDTKEDLIRLTEWAKERGKKIAVRLVKGAYWDYEVVVNRQRGWPLPVFLGKNETDMNFEELTGILLENARFVRPAIASHNIRSISRAVATAESLNLPHDAYEFQMLYGMAAPLRSALSAMDLSVRVYTPLGEFIPGMAYLIRRLLENTSDESFLRKSFFERSPFEELMKPPQSREPVAAERPSGGAFRNEPPLDFSRAKNRVRMKTALEETKGKLNQSYPLSIGGREVRTEKRIRSFNPARPDEVVGVVSSAGQKEAEEAVREAAKAWQGWRKVPPGERAEYLFRAADVMREKRFELAALEVYEAGKTWKDADGDVTEAIDYLEYYGREMKRLGTPFRPGDYPGEENEYLYEPRGIGVVISPWNFPLAIPTGMVSAAIVTGNCVIFKPSGLSPLTGWKLCEIMRFAGLPPGVLEFLPGPGAEAGEYLVAHPETDFIAFTGSKDVGLRIMRLAGETRPGQRNVKRVIAEMGGKNAIIIDETADFDDAIKGVVESALVYQGQKCSACSRVIVIGALFDEFCRRLGDAIESLKIGPPEEPGSFMGPLIDEGALKKVEHYIELGRREGNALLVRQTRAGAYFVGPAVFTGIRPDSPLAQEEIFGPVLAVMKADDIDEAIEIANSTPYGLTGGLFSRSPGNIRKAKTAFRAGNFYINRRITGALVGRQPFGGFGMSGVGSKAGGPDYLLQFMNPKSICENTLRRGFAPMRKR